MSADQEVHVLEHIFPKDIDFDRDLVAKVVKLGRTIRQKRAGGNLQSLPPPTIWGYLAFLRMAKSLPQMSLQQISMVTLLGNAATDDRKLIPSVFNEVFGLQGNIKEDDPTLVGNLF